MSIKTGDRCISLKIVIATEYVAPKDKPFFGGVNSITINFARNLAKTNEVHILTTFLDRSERIENYDGITIHRIGDKRFFTQRGNFFERLKFNKLLEDEIIKIKPDIVNPIGFVSYDGSYKGARKIGASCIVTVLEVWQGEWIKNMGLVNGIAGHILESIYLRYNFDGYIAISNFTKEKLIKKIGIPESKISILYCGVDINLYSSTMIDEKYPDPTIITVCRLVPYKRVEDLIRAVKVLKKDRDNIKLLIVGTGPEEDHLKIIVNELGLQNNVEFLGKIKEDKDLIKIMKRSHIFALTSVTEGFGMVIVEAMAAGIPYVAYDIPAIREVTDDSKGGYLLQPKNYIDLASKIDMLLSDTELRDQVTASNLNSIKKYDWPYLSSSLEGIYKNCLKVK